MKTIVVSPGHYVDYKGVEKNNYVEYNEVAKIVNILKNKFTSEYEVLVVEGKLIDKVIKTNEINPDIAVEIHLGNTNNSKIDGSRAFFMMNRPESKRLAESILNSCVNILNTTNRKAFLGWYKKISPSMVERGKAPQGWKAKIDLYLSKINCATAFIEPFYISSPSDCNKFIAGDQYELIADAIRDGIVKYFDNKLAN